MFWWRERREVGDWFVDLAFTDVAGGVSTGGWSSLNLAGHVGDDADAVATNRARVADALELPASALNFMAQVHGADVAVLPCDPAPSADAQIGADFGQALVVLVADCTPVLLYATDRPLVAAVHAGRPGMVAGVVPNTVQKMRSLGAADLRAVVGPAVCGRCYEVPDEMRSVAAQQFPASHAVSWSGTAAIDVAGGVVSQLHDLGVPLDWVPGCTREEQNLFSHRRDHGAGRFAGVVALRRNAR